MKYKIIPSGYGGWILFRWMNWGRDSMWWNFHWPGDVFATRIPWKKLRKMVK